MVIAVAVLFGLVVLRWGILFLGASLLVPRVRACPACFADTVPVRKEWLRRLAPWLRWRWCPACGWEGPSRTRESELVPAPGLRLRRGEIGETGEDGPPPWSDHRRRAPDREWSEGA